MTSDPLTRLLGATTQDEVLRQLKDLKNAIIGNTWRKVEAAEDDELLQFLLGLIANPFPPGSDVSDVQIEIINETVVIFGSLGNVGPLTLRPLLTAQIPAHILALINGINQRSLSSRTPGPDPLTRLVAPLLRALRNIMISTADMTWGNSWGVGLKKQVVDTGLMGLDDEPVTGMSAAPDIGQSSGKGKGTARGVQGQSYKEVVMGTLPLVFEPENLDSLLSLIYIENDPQTLLPLYQLLARLIALPYHRKLLAQWSPNSQLLAMSTTINAPLSSRDMPVILEHLLDRITTMASSAALGRKPNAKLVEAMIDLLAAIVKGQSKLAHMVRSWTGADPADMDLSESMSLDKEDARSRRGNGVVEQVLINLFTSSFISVRIAAASCLTNIVKADKGIKTFDRVRWNVWNIRILVGLIDLLHSESLEDKVKLCFILAALVSDNGSLQKSAADHGCTTLVIDLWFEVEKLADKGGLSSDTVSRCKEAILLALAALSFQHEPTRAFIAESTPPFLPKIHQALSHPSYGVRAAACQLARALSRTVSILRTSLVDSGVGEEVIETLKREVASSKARGRIDGLSPLAGGTEEDDDLLGGQEYTVEIAATATLCNLVADYSPLKATMLQDGGLELICDLTQSPWEPLALNALWALKNLTFHALESLKTQIMAILTYDTLKRMLGPETPQVLRIQAMEITQNLLADGSASEIARTCTLLGEDELLEVLSEASAQDQDVELRIPALYTLSNLALGNEKNRTGITSRPELLDTLSETLDAREDPVKVPALRCFRHLVESNSRSRRPRQAVVDILAPYDLKSRLKRLAEVSPSLDACHAATSLLEVLERAKDGASSPRASKVTL